MRSPSSFRAPFFGFCLGPMMAGDLRGDHFDRGALEWRGGVPLVGGEGTSGYILCLGHKSLQESAL